MRNLRMTIVTLAAVTLLAAWGCDMPPKPPKLGDGKAVTSLTPNGPDEIVFAQALVDAREAYFYRLAVLKAYYVRTGAYAKSRWVDRERKNLETAQTFTLVGLTPRPVPQAQSLAEVDELTVVEPVITARADFLAAVADLRQHYAGAGEHFNAALVESIRRRLDPIRTYMYVLDAEIPPASLTPVAVNTEAEKLYTEGMKLYHKGRILPLVVDYDKERQALGKLQELINKHPNSTRIPYAAYFIAEIYKEYFNENYRAVLWYQRAWEWEPKITKPARFQAAVLYDIRLHNYDRAIELYRQVLQLERFNWTNVNHARQRLQDLTATRVNK